MKVIDFRVRLRTSQLLKPWNPESPAPHFEQYIKLYKMEPRLSIIGAEETIKIMNSAGITEAVVCGTCTEDNKHLEQLYRNNKIDNCYLIAGLDLNERISTNLITLQNLDKKLFFGINITPCICGVPANAKELYPLYAYCELNNMVAIIHASMHYNRAHSMWLGDPKYIEDIAISFPKLKIVISHAGNGFGLLGLAITQKHPNIYLEFSALWPKYLPENNIVAINSYLKDKCIFGTDYPLLDFKENFDAWNNIVKPEVKELFFYKNAKKCLFGEPNE